MLLNIHSDESAYLDKKVLKGNGFRLTDSIVSFRNKKVVMLSNTISKP